MPENYTFYVIHSQLQVLWIDRSTRERNLARRLRLSGMLVHSGDTCPKFRSDSKFYSWPMFCRTRKASPLERLTVHTRHIYCAVLVNFTKHKHTKTMFFFARVIHQKSNTWSAPNAWQNIVILTRFMCKNRRNIQLAGFVFLFWENKWIRCFEILSKSSNSLFWNGSEHVCHINTYLSGCMSIFVYRCLRFFYQPCAISRYSIVTSSNKLNIKYALDMYVSNSWKGLVFRKQRWHMSAYVCTLHAWKSGESPRKIEFL